MALCNSKPTGTTAFDDRVPAHKVNWDPISIILRLSPTDGRLLSSECTVPGRGTISSTEAANKQADTGHSRDLSMELLLDAFDLSSTAEYLSPIMSDAKHEQAPCLRRKD
ncbi:hypothetical protein CSKR_202788 [Clonorchis sinensis]|uniref:Uncharacterized protein n=1 Tax=Clonorchis sinensis TaxID=79923 RepID=A0A8T1M3J3_CLOSI|nr:hypothetical protein CSKR_202788 [Clonorchis sinensis]